MSTVRHVFYLGSPHLGAGLEQWVSRLSGVLGKLDEGRPLASVLNRRSAGIKDLRAGYLLDDHWREAGPGRSARVSDVPLLPSANHYAVSATVTTSRRNPLGRLVGDLLVQPASARGRSREAGTSRSPSSTNATSRVCTTSTFSTIPRSTRRCAMARLPPCAAEEGPSTLYRGPGGGNPETVPLTAVRPHAPLRFPPVRGETIVEALELNARDHADRPAMRHRLEAGWEVLTWADYERDVRQLAAGLAELGVEPGETVGIVSANCVEWHLADLGSLVNGSVSVPVYPTSSPTQIAYILGHAEARVCFVDTHEQLGKVLEVRDELPRLERLILCGPVASDGRHLRDPVRRAPRARRRAPGATSDMVRRTGRRPHARTRWRRSSTRAAPPACRKVR